MIRNGTRSKVASKQIKHGDPLLCTYATKLPSPSVCSCGSKRSFEFQVMPQILNLLLTESTMENCIDWGSIYVFTCSKSCKIDGYKREEAFVLNFDSSSNIPTNNPP